MTESSQNNESFPSLRGNTLGFKHHALPSDFVLIDLAYLWLFISEQRCPMCSNPMVHVHHFNVNDTPLH